MEIVVNKVRRFGRVLYYPECEISKQLLKVFPYTGNDNSAKIRVALTKWQVEKLKMIGVRVEIKNGEI